MKTTHNVIARQKPANNRLLVELCMSKYTKNLFIPLHSSTRVYILPVKIIPDRMSQAWPHFLHFSLHSHSSTQLSNSPPSFKHLLHSARGRKHLFLSPQKITGHHSKLQLRRRQQCRSQTLGRNLKQNIKCTQDFWYSNSINNIHKILVLFVWLSTSGRFDGTMNY